MKTREEIRAAAAAYRNDAEKNAPVDTKSGKNLDTSLRRMDADDDGAGDGGGKLDKILNQLTALNDTMTDFGSRLDALEGRGGDDDDDDALREMGEPTPLAADSDDDDGGIKTLNERKKTRRDPNDMRRDSRKDADADKPIDQRFGNTADAAAFQARADAVMQTFSVHDSAPRWLQGETLINYKKRILSKLKKHSSDWKNVDLYRLNDGGALDVAADQIFADSVAFAKSPSSIPMGQLRAVNEVDQAGRRITRFYGDPEACWGMFKQQPRRLSGINLKPHGG